MWNSLFLNWSLQKSTEFIFLECHTVFCIYELVMELWYRLRRWCRRGLAYQTKITETPPSPKVWGGSGNVVSIICLLGYNKVNWSAKKLEAPSAPLPPTSLEGQLQAANESRWRRNGVGNFQFARFVTILCKYEVSQSYTSQVHAMKIWIHEYFWGRLGCEGKSQ